MLDSGASARAHAHTHTPAIAHSFRPISFHDTNTGRECGAACWFPSLFTNLNRTLCQLCRLRCYALVTMRTQVLQLVLGGGEREKLAGTSAGPFPEWNWPTVLVSDEPTGALFHSLLRIG